MYALLLQAGPVFDLPHEDPGEEIFGLIAATFVLLSGWLIARYVYARPLREVRLRIAIATLAAAPFFWNSVPAGIVSWVVIYLALWLLQAAAEQDGMVSLFLRESDRAEHSPSARNRPE